MSLNSQKKINNYNENLNSELKNSNIGKGSCFGTFGELLQGVLYDNEVDFLVTFPIECYSRAVFNIDTDKLKVFPQSKVKALKIAKMILSHFDLTLKGSLVIYSDIKIGKGLSSSSADMVATARAIESCYGIKIANELLQKFMREIEPSDGVMYPGIVSFYHRKVELCEFLGKVPPITIVGIDEGGEINTIEFNKISKPFSKEDKQEYQKLLRDMSDAVKKQDLETIGKISTRSAILNQKLIPKKNLNNMIEICEEINGIGVIVTHSGTCIGILLSQENPNYLYQVQAAKERIKKLSNNVVVHYSWKGANHEKKAIVY